MLSPASKITNLDITSQFNLVKDSQLNRVNYLLISKTMPITLYNKFLAFRCIDRKSDIHGDLLEMTTIENSNVHHAKISDKKCLISQRKCNSMKSVWVIKVLEINTLQDCLYHLLS